jgi:predicted DNA-binding protein with PD1-like motif
MLTEESSAMDNETRFLAGEGTGGRVIAARLRPGTDLIGGIAAVCRAHNIRQGYIGCIIGSLRKVEYMLPLTDETTPSGIRYSDPIRVGGPIELIGGQGVICQSPEGELMIHFHANFCDPDGKSLAGHFAAGGNPIRADDAEPRIRGNSPAEKLPVCRLFKNGQLQGLRDPKP